MYATHPPYLVALVLSYLIPTLYHMVLIKANECRHCSQSPRSKTTTEEWMIVFESGSIFIYFAAFVLLHHVQMENSTSQICPIYKLVPSIKKYNSRFRVVK